MVVAAWLFVAGIGVLRRRPWSRSAAVGWAVAKILYVIASLTFGVTVGRAKLGWAPMTTTFGCVLLWALVLPVFLII